MANKVLIDIFPASYSGNHYEIRYRSYPEGIKFNVCFYVSDDDIYIDEVKVFMYPVDEDGMDADLAKRIISIKDEIMIAIRKIVDDVCKDYETKNIKKFYSDITDLFNKQLNDVTCYDGNAVLYLD